MKTEDDSGFRLLSNSELVAYNVQWYEYPGFGLIVMCFDSL